MTNHELYRIAPPRQPTADALRTVILILATVLVGLVVTASVPDETWAELSAHEDATVEQWHGNVSTHLRN